MANGNGHANGQTNELARTTPQELIEQTPAAELMEPPPWLKALREAVSGSIQPDDIKQVMAAQVQKAKEGDMRAASFVMNQAHKLMDAQAKSTPPVTIVQNNYYDKARPDEPDTPGEEGAGARPSAPVTFRPPGRKSTW